MNFAVTNPLGEDALEISGHLGISLEDVQFFLDGFHDRFEGKDILTYPDDAYILNNGLIPVTARPIALLLKFYANL